MLEKIGWVHSSPQGRFKGEGACVLVSVFTATPLGCKTRFLFAGFLPTMITSVAVPWLAMIP